MTMQVKVGELKEGDSFSRDSGMTWWRVWDVKSHGCGDVSLTALPKRAPFRFVTERYDICDRVLRQETV